MPNRQFHDLSPPFNTATANSSTGSPPINAIHSYQRVTIQSTLASTMRPIKMIMRVLLKLFISGFIDTATIVTSLNAKVLRDTKNSSQNTRIGSRIGCPYTRSTPNPCHPEHDTVVRKT